MKAGEGTIVPSFAVTIPSLEGGRFATLRIGVEWAIMFRWRFLCSVGGDGSICHFIGFDSGRSSGTVSADDQGSGSSSARARHQAEPGTSDVGTGARDTVYVNIRNFRFHPGDLRISTGTWVVFVNEDDVAHNIVQTSSRPCRHRTRHI